MIHSWDEVWHIRESLYSFLGDIILTPIGEEDKSVLTEDFWNKFPLQVANKNMETGLYRLKNCIAELRELEEEKAIEQVAVEYTALFIGPGVPKAPPIESFYRSGKTKLFGDTTVLMRRLLEQYGLESITKYKEPEDHLGLELLFISFLTAKLKEQDDQEQLANIQEQERFINRLLQWVPEFTQDVIEFGSVGFYSGLMGIILGVLEWDQGVLKEFIAQG